MPKLAPAPRIAQTGRILLASVRTSAVREHDLGRDHVVDRQAVLAGQEADAAGGGEPADPDVAVVAGAHREPVLRERGGHVPQRAPAPTRTCRARRRG